MGKTTVANMLRDHNIAVHDSDTVVRESLTRNKDAIRDVVNVFPDCWNGRKHAIDRSVLADKVFNDADEKERLEAILHPYVWQSQKEFLLQQKRYRADIVCLDIPLLYETNADQKVDDVICVTAPPFVQYKRVTSRPNVDDELFFKILSTQMLDVEKRARAQYVIHTGLGRAYTYREVTSLVHKLRHAA